jgi:hypothetical protein
MARAITVADGAVGNQPVTVDVDTNVVGFSCTTNAVLSRDQNENWLNFANGIGEVYRKSPISFAASKAPPNGQHPAIPVLAGEVIYVVFSAAGSAIIYFDP